MSTESQQEIASESLEFSFSELNSDSPVIITEQEVQASDANRKKKQRTIRQLPVFRDTCNLAFVVEQLMVKCPRKYKCTLDEMERIVTNLLQSLDLANELKEDRNQLCAEAHSLIIALTVKFEIICRLGVINRDTLKKIKRMCQSVTSQIAGWRRSACGEGLMQTELQ